MRRTEYNAANRSLREAASETSVNPEASEEER